MPFFLCLPKLVKEPKNTGLELRGERILCVEINNLFSIEVNMTYIFFQLSLVYLLFN